MATVPITYWWSHDDGTLHRWMRDDVVVPPPPPPPPPPVTGYRFPGDTLPLKSGQLLWGISQLDGDPSERELAAGRPAGAIRCYFTGSSGLAVPNGQVWQQVRRHHSKGRVPWVSIKYTDWATQAAGASNSAWYDSIAYVEEQLHAPVPFTLMHEPRDNVISRGGTYGTEADWGNMQKAFRAQMDAYATAKAGSPGAYTWKNLSFAPILTSDTYAATGSGSADLFMTGVPSRTFDFYGVDTYEFPPKVAGNPYGTIWTTVWVKSLAWCKAHGKPVGLAEFGLPQADPQAGSKLRAFYARLLDGTNDVFMAVYFDSNPAGGTTWLLTNNSNENFLDAWLDELRDARSIHFYDTGYARPAGV